MTGTPTRSGLLFASTGPGDAAFFAALRAAVPAELRLEDRRGLWVDVRALDLVRPLVPAQATVLDRTARRLLEQPELALQRKQTI